MREAINALLDSVRPAVRAHDGELEVVTADGGVVRLKFHGKCVDCALAPLTLKLGIEPLIKKNFPDITSVIAE